MPLELTIVTAEKRIHFDRLQQVVFSTPHGQVGILPGHAPLVCQVASGVLRVFCGADGGVAADSGLPQLFAVARGLAQVAGDRVTLLLAEVLAAAEIDRERAEERLREEAVLTAARNIPFSSVEHENFEEEEAEFCAAQLEVMEILRREKGGS